VEGEKGGWVRNRGEHGQRGRCKLSKAGMWAL